MVSKRLKRIRKKLREKNQKVVPQIVTTPTNDMMNALVDRSVYETNHVSERKPSRKKLRNMRSKMANEAENPNGGANASAAMMSRLAYLMSNGNQNDMLNQRIQAVQNNIDNKNLEITYKNQLAALQERERNMVNEGKHEEMRKGYEEKIQKAEHRIKELEEEAKYKPRLEDSRLRIQELELQLRHQEENFQKEKQNRELAKSMENIQKQMEYNKREAEYQNQIYAKNEELNSIKAKVDELKDANRRSEFDYQLEQQKNAMNNDLLREAFAAQKTEITQAFYPIIEHLKNTNEQNQRDDELRQLVINQTHQIQELQHKIEYNTKKGANDEVIDALQEEVDEQKHNMEMKELNQKYERGVKRLDREKAKLNVEEKIAEAEAEAEDFRNPQTAQAEVDLNRAKHTKNLSVDLINMHRDLNKELAVAKAHFDTLGMTEGLRDAVGLSGEDDIAKSLTSEQCNGYILKEKVNREQKLRTLQEQNATLDSIIETSDKIDAVYQGVQYKKDQISKRLQGFLNNTFGENYRNRFRDDKRCKIHRDLLEEKQSEIEATADDYATQARFERTKELRGQCLYLGEDTFQKMYKGILDDVEFAARAKKKAELENALRDEAYTMADKEVNAMQVPLLPEYMPQLNTFVNQQYKISQAYAKDVDGMMDKIAETETHNTNIAEFVRVLQQREISSGFGII